MKRWKTSEAVAVRSILDTSDRADDISALLDSLTSVQGCEGDHLRQLQDALYQHGPIDRSLAARIFHANRIMTAAQDGWIELYLATLTRFFLEYQQDKFVFSDQSGAILLSWLGDQVPIVNVGERRLALRILLRAASVSEPFEQRVLEAVADNLLYRSERWQGAGSRSAGLIDKWDLNLIRRLVRSDESQYPTSVSRPMMRFLLELDQEARFFSDAGGWRALLVTSVIRHLSPEATSGCQWLPAQRAEFTTKLKALLDDGYGPDEAKRLRDDVLVAMQNMSCMSL